MATGTYAMITNLGLNGINSDQYGPYIEVAYYVPAYDWRIDSDINNLYDDAMKGSGYQVSSCTSPSDIVPSGIVYWGNVGGYKYEITPNVYVLSADGTTHDTTSITNAKQSSYTQMTITDDSIPSSYGVTPPWSFLSMNSVLSVTQGSGVADFTADLVGEMPIKVIGPGDPSAFDPNVYLYKGVSYNEVVVSGTTDTRANFRVSVKAPNGPVKFNKLGLYAVHRLSNGDINSNPFLFGQVVFPETQIVNSEFSSTEGEVGELIVDFQMDVQSATRNFSDVMYATSADYWQQVSDITDNNNDGTFGISYSGNVYVTNRLAVDDKNFYFNTSADRGVAKMLVSTFEQINAINPSREKDMPQMCLQYVVNKTTTAPSKRLRTTFNTTSAGDCVVDFYGQCGNVEYHPAILPYADAQFNLGSYTNRWRDLYAGTLSLGKMSSSITPKLGYLKINALSDSPVARIVNMNVNLERYSGNTSDYFFCGNIRNVTDEAMFIRSGDVNTVYIDVNSGASAKNSDIMTTIDKKFTFTDWFSKAKTVFIAGDVAVDGKIVLAGDTSESIAEIDGIIPNAGNTINLGSFDLLRYGNSVRKFKQVITAYLGSDVPTGFDTDYTDSTTYTDKSISIGNHVIPGADSRIDVGHYAGGGRGAKRFRNACFSGFGSFGSIETQTVNVGAIVNGGRVTPLTSINGGSVVTQGLSVAYTGTVKDSDGNSIPNTQITSEGIYAPFIQVRKLVAETVDMFRSYLIDKHMSINDNTCTGLTDGWIIPSGDRNWIIPFYNTEDFPYDNTKVCELLGSGQSLGVGIYTYGHARASVEQSIFYPNQYRLVFPSMTHIPVICGSSDTSTQGNLGQDDVWSTTPVPVFSDFILNCVRCASGNFTLIKGSVVVSSTQNFTNDYFSIYDANGSSVFKSDYDQDTAFKLYVTNDDVLMISPYNTTQVKATTNDGSFSAYIKTMNEMYLYFTCDELE